MTIADAIARIKGESPRRVNLQRSEMPEFKWQADYGVVSLTSRALLFVLDYIASQKQRHRDNELLAALEFVS